jgi:hypothetical protein
MRRRLTMACSSFLAATNMCGAQDLAVSSKTTAIDMLHPTYFVRVYEDTRKGERRPIHANNPKSPTDPTSDCLYSPVATDDDRGPLAGQPDIYAYTQVDYEVDYRSQIAIQFDRAFMECVGDAFEGEITIKGQIKSAGGPRDLKIPGYWQAGEAQPSVVARLRSTREIIDTANELDFALETLDRDVKAAIDQAVEATQEVDAEEGTADWMRTLDSGGVLDEDDLEIAFDAAIAAGNVWADANEAAVSALLRRLAVASSPVMKQIAAVQRRDADALTALANTALTTWLPELRATQRQLANPGGSLDEQEITALKRAQFNRIANLIELQRAFYLDNLVVGELTQAQVDANYKLLQARLFAALKDTVILPSVDGAVPGDTLILTIVNGAEAPQNRRELTLQLRVAEFGVKREVIDSALFIRRDVADVDLAAAINNAQASGTAETVEASEDSNFTPAPGVTLAWTYLPRERDGHKALRFLQPGWGVNVSFPQFDSTVATFTPGSGTTPASTTFSQTDSDIDVAVGLVFSLFNNRLQFSYGRIMTVEEDEDYAAIGFSFVNLIRGARNAEN